MGKNGNLQTFISLGSPIIVDSDCSHEIKRHLLLGRKAMTNLYSILKSRDITLPTKVHLVKAMIFPVVKYRCKSGTINKADRRRMDAFKLCCWIRLLRVDCTEIKPISPKGNQPWIFIVNVLAMNWMLQWIPEAEAEVSILWPPDVKSRLTGKDPDAGKDWGQEEKWVAEDEMVG